MRWFNRSKPTRWERQPGDIAIRIEAEDVRRIFFDRPFVVQEGTVALVFSKGAYAGRLEYGEHDLDGSLRKWLVRDDPTVFVVVDEGDLALDVRVAGLSSREHHAVDLDLRLTLRIEDPEAFHRNVMRDRRRYAEADLRPWLEGELHDALLAFTATHAVDDLYGNPALRGEVDSVVRARMESALRRMGFTLVAAEVTKVAAPTYDAHRAEQAKVDLESREAEISAVRADVEEARLAVLRKIRQDRAADRRHEAESRAELEDAVRQAIHELGLKDRLRADELARLEQSLAHDLADFEQQRTQQRERSADEHARDLDADRREHEREQTGLDLVAFLDRRIRTAEADARVADTTRETTAKDYDLARRMRDDALAARRRKKMDDVEIERERAATLAGADTATKLALGIGDRDALLEIARMEHEGRLDPQQALVRAAAQSEACANALAEQFRAEGRMNEELMEHLKRQIEADRQRDREQAGRLERVMDRALEQMGRVAGERARADGPGDQTIVTGGGGFGGPATVIEPNRRKRADDAELADRDDR